MSVLFCSLRVIRYRRELFVHIFDVVFAQFFNLSYFPVFFLNFGMLTNLIFLAPENFTQPLEIMKKTLSDTGMN